MTYQKFFYWVSPKDLGSVLESCKQVLKKDQIPEPRESPCEALYLHSQVMHVPPAVWSKRCYRQGSWFRTSPYASLHLIVSNSALELPQSIKKGTIEIIEVENCPSLTKEKYLDLLKTKEFKKRAPNEWFHFLEKEVPGFTNYIERKQLGLSLDELLEMHSANHANFVLPEGKTYLKIDYKGESLACSLFSEEYICSACLELFGVIGDHLRKKVIKKCPGLKYVNLDSKEYFLVSMVE
jgi:hypothetical protein